MNNAQIVQFIFDGKAEQWQVELNIDGTTVILDITTQQAINLESALKNTSFEEIQDLKGRITYVKVN